MNNRIVFAILSSSASSPVYYRNKVSFSENLSTNFLQILNLVVINRDKYHAILRQQVSCHLQSWINHIQPIGVEASVALGIRNKTVALLVKLS